MITNGYAALVSVGPVIVAPVVPGAGNMNPSEVVAAGGEPPLPGFVAVPGGSVAVPVKDPVHSAPLGQHAMLFPES